MGYFNKFDDFFEESDTIAGAANSFRESRRDGLQMIQALGVFVEDFLDRRVAKIAPLYQPLGQLILPKCVAVGKICGRDDEVIAKLARDIGQIVIDGARHEDPLRQPAIDLGPALLA
jgi:hypothetical protein